eukprot:6175739-Pleurochrysis_carterae.AAC.1
MPFVNGALILRWREPSVTASDPKATLRGVVVSKCAAYQADCQPAPKAKRCNPALEVEAENSDREGLSRSSARWSIHQRSDF